MFTFTFFCYESGEEIKVQAGSRCEAYDKANQHFRPLWAKKGIQFYGWQGGGYSFYASYGVWN